MGAVAIPHTTPRISAGFLNSIMNQLLKDPASVLPYELMLRIFSLLDLKGINRCSLVCKKWRQISAEESLWVIIFNSTDLSHLKTELSFINKSWIYRDLASIFKQSGRFRMAIAACEKCASIDAHNGAYGFRDLSKTACTNKDYKAAAEFQQLAKKHHADAGSDAMSYFIKCQVADSNFLEASEQLIAMSVALIDEDREFGLQALMTIAEKFANLQLFDEAMECTQQARTLGDSKVCKRARDHSDGVHPFVEMGKHMLSLKQYKLAEECARKLEASFYHPESLYSDIIIKQATEENFINEPLLAELKPETLPWTTAYEGLVFALIEHKRFDEAQIFAKTRLQTKWDYNLREFRSKLRVKLSNLSIDTSSWFI